jgi:predicted nucleic acid-binding protein
VLMDAACFRQWARLMHRRTAAFYVDAMIAATVLVHDFTVATRNVRDFSPSASLFSTPSLITAKLSLSSSLS